MLPVMGTRSTVNCTGESNTHSGRAGRVTRFDWGGALESGVVRSCVEGDVLSLITRMLMET